MKIVTKVALWILAVFFLILTCMTNIIGLVAVVLILPIDKWQELLSRYIKKPIRIIAIVLSVILMIAAVSSCSDDPDGVSSDMVLSSSDTYSSDELNTEESSSEAIVDSSTVVESSGIESSSETPTSSKVSSETPVVAPPVHTHSFSEATCTEAGKCSCGETGNAALGHNYVEGSCSRCGAADPNYSAEYQYVLNTKTKKFHEPSCGSLPTENRQDITATRDSITEQGYSPCGICKP